MDKLTERLAVLAEKMGTTVEELAPQGRRYGRSKDRRRSKLQVWHGLLAVAAVALIAVALTYSGLQSTASAAPSGTRFRILHKEGCGYGNLMILEDKYTGRKYLWGQNHYAGGLTVLAEKEE